ncbi:hypothetical protein Tco_0642186 [Tanacetum coccineum]
MMANLSEDIQCAGSDTRPPMRDRSDFESWKQRIRFYCLGKDNGENILKSIDEGPFKMGKFRETLAEGALHLGPERDRVFAELTPKEKKRFKADNRATNILLQGLPKDIYTLINHYIDAKDIWDNVKMLLEGSELTKDERESQLYDEFEHFRQNKRETIHEYYVRGRFVTAVKLNRGLRTSNYDQMYAYLKQHKAYANENKMMLERYNQHAIDPLAFGRQNKGPGNNARGAVAAGNVGFQNRVGNANPDKMLLMQAQENGVVLDEEQLLFIAGGQPNTFDDDVDEAPVQDLALNEENVFQADQCDAFDSDVDEAPTAQTMFMANLSSTDPIYDEAVQVVQSNVSFVPNDALMMIFNDMHEHAAQCVSVNEHHKVVNESLTAELARYKEQVQLYEKRARFELTEREQKIDEQMRIIIRDRNVKEELLKKELHSVKMQLYSTINHNKLIKEEVTTLKKDFKQKENKYLEEFLDMKQLKEKVEDKLYKQDQSFQTVHILCKPNPVYDEKKKMKHAPAVVHDSKDTLELAKTTRMKMLEKSKSTLWIDSKIKIAPPDYLKENYLATFTPQRHLTPK